MQLYRKLISKVYKHYIVYTIRLCLEHNRTNQGPNLPCSYPCFFLPDMSQASKHLIKPTYHTIPYIPHRNIYNIQTHKYLPQVVIKISRPCKQIPDTTPLSRLLLPLLFWPTNNPTTRSLFLLKRSLQMR